MIVEKKGQGKYPPVPFPFLMSKNFPFAKRTDWALGSNQLMKTVELLQERKVPLLDLTESNPTKCGFRYLSKQVLTPFSHEDNLKYHPHPQGMEGPRAALSAYYRERGYDVPPENIFLVASTSEGYSCLFRLLANPGEHFLFPSPSYPLFPFLVDLNDVEMDFYPLVYEDGWKVDLKRLRQGINAATRGLVFVNPNNPTGSYIKEDELGAFVQICREHHAAIISDEVFWDFNLDPSVKRLSLAGNKECLTFVLSGISKTLGLPQMKLGWILISGPDDLVKEARARLEIITDTYLSVATPAQNALTAWLSHQGRIQTEIRDRLTQNLRYLKKSTAPISTVKLLEIEGGWYAILKIPTTLSEERWAIKFLEEDHVFVHPGYFFDFEKEGYIVVSLLPEKKIFQDGIDRILKRINKV